MALPARRKARIPRVYAKPIKKTAYKRRRTIVGQKKSPMPKMRRPGRKRM